MTDSCVVTIVDKGFEPGAIALVNSLAKAGFRSRVILFCRDPAARDTVKRTLTEGRRMPLPFEVELRSYVPECSKRDEMAFQGIIWQSWEKTQILPMALQEHERVWYFDPDIVVHLQSDVFDFWSSDAVAVVADAVWHPMHRDHVKNWAFRAILEHAGMRFVERDFYANAGFIGIGRQHTDLLAIWRDALRLLSPDYLADVARCLGLDIARIVHWDDQDGLNLALRATDVRVKLMGPAEGMGFGSLRQVAMYHAAGMRKPWRGSALGEMIRRRHPPAPVHRAFLEFVDEPVRVWPRWRQLLARADYLSARVASSLLGFR